VKLINLKSEFSSEFQMLRTTIRRLVLWFLIVGAIAYLFSGVYVVGVNETGVLKRFGRIVDDRVAPGLHYRLPWPIDKVTKVSTKEIRRLQAGFGADPEQIAEFERAYGTLDRSQSGSFMVPYCITGDKNIIHAKVIAQCRIDDPKAYLVGFKDAEGVVLGCIQSAILSTLSQTDVDSALTAGKVMLQQEILKDVQRQLTVLNTGISVISAEIKNTRPPSNVARAFKDVINAREERRTMVHDAQAYRNQVIPQGKAEASRIQNEAEAYKTRKIAHAEGESKRFVMLANEYMKDKEIARQRLYLDAIGEILPTVQKIIVGSDQGQDIATLRFFTQGDNRSNR
jgi:membrane protease subunit HflK